MLVCHTHTKVSVSKPKLSFASHRPLRNRLTIGAIKAAFRRSQQRQIADLIAASCPRLLSFLLFSLFFFSTKKRDRIFFAIFGYATVVPWCWDQHRNLLAHCAVRFFSFPPNNNTKATVSLLGHCASIHMYTLRTQTEKKKKRKKHKR